MATRLGADRAGGSATPVGTPASATAFSAPAAPKPAYVPDALHDHTKQPVAPKGSTYVWIPTDAPSGGMWSLHQNAPVVGGGNTSGNTNASGTGSGNTSTAPTEPIDHSTESGTNAINDILNGLIGFSPAEIANFYNEYKSGLPLSRIVDDIRSTPQYAQRFPGMAALAKTGNRISEASYIAHETQARELLQTYLGPSASQYDTTAQLGQLIANNVSPAELQGRLQAANDAVLAADPKTVQWLKDQGLSQGDLTAYWLNPDVALTDIQRRANMGQLGGAAAGAGVNINAATADQLARQGTTVDQAKAGFGKIGLDGQLEQNLPGDTTGSVTQQDLINATFNNDAVAQQKISRVQQGRTAEFQAGGQFATDSKGVAGLGVAATS